VRSADFALAYSEGGRARGLVVVIVARPNGTEHTRLGLSVGRSVWRSAVKRNRVRRVFREAFRLSYAELPRGADVVMIPAAPGLDPDPGGTREELGRLAPKALSKAGAKRPAPASKGVAR